MRDVTAARDRLLRFEVTDALVRLSAGTPQSREEMFNGKADPNKSAWQRKILDRLEKSGYIRRVDAYGTARFAKYAVSEGKTLQDFLDDPKKLTALIWPGLANDQVLPPVPPEEPPPVTPPAKKQVIVNAEPPAEDDPQEDESIPDDQFKAAVLKILFGMSQEFSALKEAFAKNAAVIERLASELGVK
jgi:hypothetical protein